MSSKKTDDLDYSVHARKNRDLFDSINFSSLQAGVKVFKCSRRGKPREITLALSQDQTYISWDSNSFGPKLGQLNNGEQFSLYCRQHC
jgi:hypothetical protein